MCIEAKTDDTTVEPCPNPVPTDEDMGDDYVRIPFSSVSLFSRPPLGECNRCHRQSWTESELGTEDQVTQPDGNPCGGRIVERT